MNWIPLIIIFVVAWVLQGVLTYFQVRNYKNKIGELEHKGYVGIGKKTKKLGRGRILLLVGNVHREIIHAEELKGITVFARFEENKELIGYSMEELKQINLDNEDLKEAVTEAVEDLETKFNENSKNSQQCPL